jgi:hypothetical protein
VIGLNHQAADIASDSLVNSVSSEMHEMAGAEQAMNERAAKECLLDWTKDALRGKP